LIRDYRVVDSVAIIKLLNFFSLLLGYTFGVRKRAYNFCGRLIHILRKLRSTIRTWIAFINNSIWRPFAEDSFFSCLTSWKRISLNLHVITLVYYYRRKLRRLWQITISLSQLVLLLGEIRESLWSCLNKIYFSSFWSSHCTLGFFKECHFIL
jgi:hypothetical protein